ncbi:phage tail protein [Roseomonas terrae]|uniref:Phage tail protein n=1 Tax=Neoroseomonas terrae TaxID=424799 RepID=A0ABS5EH75_9PROT|nr:phage tail sheath subtilisin-like domain-containing protein [Neoroseomonas terrae]MBR0650376.1 phage tail protein [Neoroseomonas terrae]
MAVAFNLIPIDLRTPGTYIEVDNSQAVRGLSILPPRVLIIGQKLATGSAPVNTMRLISDVAQVDGLFGRASQLAAMCWAFRGANPTSELWAMPVVDLVAGVAATNTVVFAGTATAPGTQALYVGGRRIRTPVTLGMTAAQLATAVAAAVNADADAAVTASAATATVTLTAKHKGLCGNDIDVRAAYYSDDAQPAGITVTVNPMAGGTGNPDIAPALAAVGDEWFTDIIVPWNDAANLTALGDDLVARFGPLRMVDCHGWRATSNTHSNLVAAMAARNCPHISPQGWEGSPTPPWITASALASVCIAALAIDPARPVQTLLVPGVMPPAAEKRFTRAQRNTLLFNGISTLTVDAGGNVVVERVVTEYRQTSAGAADTSYLNVETVKTVTYLRYDVRTFFSRKYPRHKLAADGTRFGAGQPVMTPKLAKAELVARFEQWEEAGLVQDRAAFMRDVVTEISGTDPDRLNALIPPTVINQLRVFAGLLQFRL